MPYNYLIDYHIRKQFDPNNYENSIIIFDEAHNVTKVAEEASSYDIKENDLIQVMKAITKLNKSISGDILGQNNLFKPKKEKDDCEKGEHILKEEDDENDYKWRSQPASLDRINLMLGTFLMKMQ